jgi:riboflavin kinase/FMN adenylyltransferase
LTLGVEDCFLGAAEEPKKPMRILRHCTDVPAKARGAVVALGNFDGVHLGHRAVIGRAKALAVAAAVPLAVVTFEPHPRTVLEDPSPPFRLTPLRTKAHHLEHLGVDILVVLHFDQRFAHRRAQDFVIDTLVEGLNASHVVVGYDFMFGYRRGGTSEMLRRMAEQEGFGFTSVPPVRDSDGVLFSSTAVRDALQAGRPREAARLLGRDWEMEGRVERGDSRGARLGYPTANLHPGEYLRPATGIYAVRAGIDHGEQTLWYDGAASFGHNPTFPGSDLCLEVHLFDFNGDLYGKHLRVALVEYLREERRFDSVEGLTAQMAQDCARARRELERGRRDEAGLGANPGGDVLADKAGGRLRARVLR